MQDSSYQLSPPRPRPKSQALAIGVPSTLVKPFRSPVLKKRLWDNDTENSRDSQQGSASKIPRRLGMTPARVSARPQKATRIFIPKHNYRDEVEADKRRKHAELSVLSDPIAATPAAGSRPTLGRFSFDDMDAESDSMYAHIPSFSGIEGDMGECMRLAEQDLDEREGEFLMQRRRAIRRSAATLLDPAGSEPQYRYGKSAKHQLAITFSEADHDNDSQLSMSSTDTEEGQALPFTEPAGPMPGHHNYSSPQVKPRSSSPSESRFSAMPSSPCPKHHVAPSEWSRQEVLPSLQESVRDSEAPLLESKELQDRAPVHAEREICDALGGNMSPSHQDHGLSDTAQDVQIHAGEMDHREEGSVEDSRSQHADTEQDGQFDSTLEHPSLLTSTTLRSHEDHGLSDDRDEDELPSMSQLQASTRVTLVMRKADGVE
ncbi:hypothetical protein OC861_005218 [Tilletia horrida]|nr:hypothetical protein OC861_005218 [Tilletia horrida]